MSPFFAKVNMTLQNTFFFFFSFWNGTQRTICRLLLSVTCEPVNSVLFFNGRRSGVPNHSRSVISFDWMWHWPLTTVCSLFLYFSTVKWETRSCTWRHLRPFWVPWALGSCWDTALLSSPNLSMMLTLDCGWMLTRRLGLGYDVQLQWLIITCLKAEEPFRMFTYQQFYVTTCCPNIHHWIALSLKPNVVPI